jgi:c-di-GMP-binding flagellar brake protein YcgR
MCRLRNRVHIQNEKKEFEPDDWDAFTERRKERAEDVLLMTIQAMADKYPRNQRRQFVRDFELPFG